MTGSWVWMKVMRRVVVDGFAALQQATFASPKRKSIEAYKEFAEIGGARSMCRRWKKRPSSRKPQRRCSSGSRPMLTAATTFYDLLVAEAAKASEMIDSGAMKDLK
jgi:hypothetical protein